MPHGGKLENLRDFKAPSPRARHDGVASLAGLALLALTGWPVHAQMQLPGATNGQAADAPPKEAGAPPIPAAPPKPIIIKPPGEDTIVGIALKQDGLHGIMMFGKSGSDVTLTKLSLSGDKLSKPTESCTVDVTMTPPIAARALGQPVGADRFDVPVPLCPFTVDVLDGAVLVSPAESTCDVAAADCRIRPTGLWGPSASEISPKRAQEMESARTRLETTMRTNFRALLRRAGKNRDAVKAVAREQAAFSSDREVTCRDYDQESVLGFCSTQITEARVLALIAQFGPESGAPRDHKRTKPKPKPAVTSAAPTSQDATSPTVGAQ